MSMRDYGVDDYGLMLTKETMKYLSSQICAGYSDEEYEKDKYSFIECVESEIDSEYIGEFTGEAIKIQDDGRDDWFLNGDNFSAETIHYLPIRNYPSLFKAAYKNMDEIIEEMKDVVGDYLPSDFDYRNNIRHIVGTYYG